MDIFSFLGGLRAKPIDRGWRRSPVLQHEIQSISGYVESLSTPRRIFRTTGSSESDLAWGVVVNFALHVMGHARRGLIFADAAWPVETALVGNEEKNVLVALGAQGLQRWIRGLGSSRRPLLAWFENHSPVRWGRARSLTSDGAAWGVVAIHSLAEPSAWAFHLMQNRKHLAPGVLIVAMGGAEEVQAFIAHLGEAFGEVRSSVGPFGHGEASRSICVCQAAA